MVIVSQYLVGRCSSPPPFKEIYMNEAPADEVTIQVLTQSADTEIGNWTHHEGRNWLHSFANG